MYSNIDYFFYCLFFISYFITEFIIRDPLIYIYYFCFWSIWFNSWHFCYLYEKLLHLTTLAIKILLFFSCINYPIQIFPEFFQSILRLNPFYYLFDLLRLSWYYGINSEVVLNELGIFHIFSVIILSIIMPIISIAIFNLFYKKFAIRGY